MPFDFKKQHDFDLHIALEVPAAELPGWLEKSKQAGLETRGIIDHEFITSVYFRDPDGYVIELSGKQPSHAEAMNPDKNNARANLQQWQSGKSA